VITSSKIDTLAMAAAFHPLTIQDMWPTGLPRNDFILRREELLPDDLRAEEQRLRDEVAGRRLVMFLPTFKNGQASSYYTFSSTELDWLRDWSRRTGAVIGVREHMADKAHTYSRMLSRLDTIDLSSRRYPDLEVLYRVADGLVTDYSSCLVDFMLTGKPVVSFAYDHDRYANEERGLFYDLDEVVPGPVCRDFAQFAQALDQLFDAPSPTQLEDYDWKRARFFDHLDDHNAARVVERVKRLYVSGL
jgi:CDP-glycerol glycerophosphotransferase (TagB/SpsB family)